MLTTDKRSVTFTSNMLYLAILSVRVQTISYAKSWSAVECITAITACQLEKLSKYILGLRVATCSTFTGQ